MKLILLLSILTTMLFSFSYTAQAQEEGDAPQVEEGFYNEGEDGDEEDDGFETVEDEPLPVIERKKDKIMSQVKSLSEKLYKELLYLGKTSDELVEAPCEIKELVNLRRSNMR